MTNADDKTLMAAVEAVLFTMGKAVEGARIAEALEISEEELEDVISALSGRYEEEDSGIRLIRLDDSYQLCTKQQYYETLIRVASRPQKPVMTQVLLEVLSIIAYKQPVTRQEIERIRGVSADYAINRLIEFGLVEEAGRLDAPGRPILFGTTEEFLRAFGLSSVRELPEISEDLQEKARENVFRTAGYPEDRMEGQMELSISEDRDVSVAPEGGENEENIDFNAPVNVEI